MKGIAVLLLCVFFSPSVRAQISITASSLTYTQDFNSLDSAGTSQTTMPAGWSFYEWGGSSANTAYRAGTGSSTTGDTYSFGAANSRERSLGSLCSSGVPNVNYGARFINSTTAYINAVTVTFKAEQWRRSGSGNTDSVRFYYSTAPGKTIADTSFSAWYQVPALLMTSITTASPAAAVNGNDTAKVITATIPVALPAGDTILLRWYDYNSAGNDDGLSIDSLTVAFNIGLPAALYKPAIAVLSPAPNTSGISAATNLTITFDKNITKGISGAIFIKDRAAQTTQTIAVSSSNVSVSGKVATISGVGLQYGRTYHVTFDSAAFDAAGFPSMGIYDTTAWMFTTLAAGMGNISRSGTLPVRIANPARDGTFNMGCNMPQPAVLNVRIYDLDGHNTGDYTLQATTGDNCFLLHTMLPAGLYIVHVDDGREWAAMKVALP